MPDVLYIVRRDADSGGKLSTSTIIIIAVVSGSVAILVFALFAWRLLVRYCRASRTVPLPPVQDLAHHREQQLVAIADRNTAAHSIAWTDQHLYQSHPKLYASHFLSASASSASLIRSSPDFTASRGPTRESSWAVEDATSAESSPFPTPLSTEGLMPPNPSFLPGVSSVAHNSMTSVSSSSSDVISDLNPNTPASPSDLNHSVESSASFSNSAHGSPVRPRPPRASRSRSRPMSTVSAAGTMYSIPTSQSGTNNTVRGAPHSIHSNIHIVLPAPLAPDLYPGAGGGSERGPSLYGGVGDRKSVADPWVLAASRPPSVARFEREASSSSRLSSAGPRVSVSRQRSGLSQVSSSSSLRDTTDSASMKARRARSQPPIPRAPSAPAVTRSRTPSPGPGPPRPTSFQPQPGSPLPPVPRVPSIYGRASFDNGRYNPPASPAREQQQARGRPPRGFAPVPMAAPVPGPVNVVDGQTPLHSSYSTPRREPSGKLRKSNRASTQDKRTSRS